MFSYSIFKWAYSQAGIQRANYVNKASGNMPSTFYVIGISF